MKFSEVLNALNEASAFELFRLRAAINAVLDEPARLQAVKAQLQLGQQVEYFDARANAKRHGTLLEFRRKGVVLLDRDDGKHWLIEYVSINVDRVDVQIRQATQRGLSRNEISVGDTVGFLDRSGQQRSGKVTRLNDKTASLSVGSQHWRVAYGLLHRVLDVDAAEENQYDTKGHGSFIAYDRRER